MARIKTQKQLDEALAKNPDGDFEIEASAELSLSLFGSAKPILRLFGKTKMSIVAWETSSPHVVAWETSSPHVVAWGTSSPRIEAWETSSPHVVAWGTSSPSIVARETSSPRIEAWETSSPHVVAWGTSSPRIEAWETSSPHVEAKGFVSLSIFGRVIATLSAKCHAMIRGEGAQVIGGQQTVVDLKTAQDHFDYYGYAAEDIPLIENLDAKIIGAIKAGGSLDMGDVHTCDTTHCRAGWAVVLAGNPGWDMEEKHGWEVAGKLLYLRSYPDLPVPNFFASNEAAMEDIEARAALADAVS